LVNNLLLVALCVAIFWGTFFPLISEFFTGQKSSLAAPWFDRYTTPLAIVLVLFTGIGPLLAWRRVSWASAKRVFLAPSLVAAATALGLALFSDAPSRPWAFALFTFAAFALAGLSQEFWRGAAARRKLAGGSMPAALVGVVARNRRRYGGYIVHAGIAVLLIGIAASSSFQTNREVKLRPGQSTTIDGRKITYVKPTVSADKQAIAVGSLLRVQQGGKTFTTTTDRRYFLPTGVPARTIGSRFAGEAESDVSLHAGLRSDLWIAVRPDLSGVLRRARAADKGFKQCARGAPGTPSACRVLAGLMAAAAANPALAATAAERIERLQSQTAARIAQSYTRESTPATFKVIVDPLVSWLWLGGLISLLGAIVALWPSRRLGAVAPGADQELEALKEAKYREIRDSELDHAAGKLSDADFALLDAELRREAVEILDRGNGNGNGNGSDPVATRPTERT
jgi:cytochrome c-type biogenesis protein CcmF